MPKPKFPSEVFGYPYFDHSTKAEEARAKHLCPFVDKVCYKQSRLIDFPFGVCTAHVNDDEVALCPRRFLDRDAIFTDIARHHFNTIANILVFSEIRLVDVGSFDFVMVKHRPLSAEIEDFVVVEFQTGQTTGTGQLVQGLKDFLAGEKMAYKSYGFGLNMYDIWKRTFTQILNKGVIMESWKKRIYWVVQEPVYRNFEERYNLQKIKYDPRHSTVFALYDLKRGGDRFDLLATRKTSASIDQLFGAFRNNPNIPSLDTFLAGLKGKIEAEAQVSLHLGVPSKQRTVDVHPPTSSGRVRETGPNIIRGDLFDNGNEVE